MRRRGFVLVDGIVAGVLLGVGLTVIIGLTGAAIAAQAHGESLQTAASLADERLAMVVALGPERFEAEGELSGRFPDPDERFRFEMDIEEEGAGNPYYVSVEVIWGDRQRERLFIETFVAPRQGDEPDPDREPDRPVDRP